MKKTSFISFFLILISSYLYSQGILQNPKPEVLETNGNIISGSGGSFSANGFIMNIGSNGEPLFLQDLLRGYWYALGSGVSSTVTAIAISGSDVYVAGTFSTAGGISANRIAKWNGINWSALGSGMNGQVLAIAISGSNVYAGGYFTTAGGVSANYIAKWDGTNWSALGSGLNSYVHSLATSGTDVYAGGYFTNNIAKWNGTNWSALGGGVDHCVRAIAISGNDVYIGGEFTNYLAKWNGTSWSSLGSGVNSYVTAISVSGSDVYVGGYFTTAGGDSSSRIAKWNGTSWSSLGSGVNSNVDAISVSGSDVYVGGYFTTAGGDSASRIAKWNGTSWSSLGSGVNSYVKAIAISGSDVYVGGNFTTAGGDSAKRIAVWMSQLVAPTLILPANNATGVSLTPLLDWNDVSGSTSYRLQVSTNSGFTSTIINDSTLTTSQYTVASGLLTNNVMYYWRVNAKNAGGTSAYSTVFNFTTLLPNPPVSPTLLLPTNGAIVVSLTPLLDWNNVTGATSYRLQVSTNSGFIFPIINDSTLTVSQYTVPNGLLMNNNVYYWRVNAKNIGGISPYSSVFNFNVVITSIRPIGNEIPNQYKLYDNYPNPFNPVTMIKFDIPKQGLTKLVIYNILGEEVGTLLEVILEAGTYQINLDASGYPSGIYFYRINTLDFTEVKRMILLK